VAEGFPANDSRALLSRGQGEWYGVLLSTGDKKEYVYASGRLKHGSGDNEIIDLTAYRRGNQFDL
jgi:hypothetical protein